MKHLKYFVKRIKTTDIIIIIIVIIEYYIIEYNRVLSGYN